MDKHLRPTSFDLNGFCFSALSAGKDGARLVILLHGFPQFADAWASLMPVLAATGFHVVALDQRGYSQAARPAEIASYHVDHLIADVLALSDSLGAETFHLVGHDWGGLVAWKLAADHPGRVLTLTVLSTPHGAAFRAALANNAEQQEKSKYIQLFRLAGHVAENVLLADHAKLLRGAYQGKVEPTQVESNVRRLCEPGALTAALNWYRAIRSDFGIGKVRVPTLYIWGDQDLALGRTAAEATAQFVEGPYTFKILTGYSHWLLEEAPTQVAQLLLSHLGHAQ